MLNVCGVVPDLERNRGLEGWVRSFKHGLQTVHGDLQRYWREAYADHFGILPRIGLGEPRRSRQVPSSGWQTDSTTFHGLVQSLTRRPLRERS